MPRGGNHGGGRPRIPPESKRKTEQYVLLPVLIDAIVAIGENKSHTVEAIFLKYFGVTPLQWDVYTTWIKCDRQFNLTAEKLERETENIRQNVATVERKLGVNNRLIVKPS